MSGERVTVTPAQMVELRAMLDETVLAAESLTEACRSLEWLAARAGELPGLADCVLFLDVALAHANETRERIVRAGEKMKVAVALAVVTDTPSACAAQGAGERADSDAAPVHLDDKPAPDISRAAA